MLIVITGLVMAGCGGDDSASESGTDEAALEATVKGWLLEGGCDRMTDAFLEEQTFNDDPAAACELFESTYAPPSYSEDDIEVTEVTIDGESGTAVVGGGGVDITSEYSLVIEDGRWKIDSAEID